MLACLSYSISLVILYFALMVFAKAAFTLDLLERLRLGAVSTDDFIGFVLQYESV